MLITLFQFMSSLCVYVCLCCLLDRLGLFSVCCCMNIVCLWTYPLNSKSERRRLFLQYVFSNLVCLSLFLNSIKAPNGSTPFSLDSSIGVTAQIEIERRRSPRDGRSWCSLDDAPLMLARYVLLPALLPLPVAVPACWFVDTDASSASCAAKHGSDPATEPDVELSRRNKPITDFICFGFDSAPSHSFFFYYLFKVCCNCIQVRDNFFFKLCICVWNSTVLPIQCFRYFFFFVFAFVFKEMKRKCKNKKKNKL